MFSVDDSPRARRDDPVTSHRAADRSQATRAGIRRAVLIIVNAFGPTTGTGINEAYRRSGFERAHFDSPRKRAGELAADGYLTADRANGVEAVYHLTDAGRAALLEVTR